MSRQLILAGLFAAAGVAHAQPAPPDAALAPVAPPGPSDAALAPVAPPAPTDAALAPVAPPGISDQGIAADVGVALGGRLTPGGLRVAGHYLYQLSDRDWFDGVAAFTFGGTTAACFRDRMNAYVCQHGIAQGDAAEIDASVRRFMAGHGAFWPYLRAGIGAAIVRFPKDDVSGLAIPLHAGAGVRVTVSPLIAITAEAELAFGVGFFGSSLGPQPQVGFAVTAGAEFRL